MAFPLIQLCMFGIIVGCDLGSSFYDRYYLNVNDQIGYAAHFGGKFLNGSGFQKIYLFYFRCSSRTFSRHLHPQKHKREKLRKIYMVGCCGCLCITDVDCDLDECVFTRPVSPQTELSDDYLFTVYSM